MSFAKVSIFIMKARGFFEKDTNDNKGKKIVATFTVRPEDLKEIE